MEKLLGIIGFLISIIGVIVMFFIPLFGLIFGLIGFILCLIQIIKEKSKLAILGLIISIILIIWGITSILLPLIVSNTVDNTLSSGKNAIENSANNIGK